jgi:hypothetical protein
LVFYLSIPFLLMLIAGRIGNIFLSLILYFWGLLLSGPLAFFYALCCSAFDSKRHVLKYPAVLIVFSFLVTLIFSSQMSLFDYPRNAQLVPFSVFSSFGDVCIGPDRLPLSLIRSTFLDINSMSLKVALLLLLPVLLFYIQDLLLAKKYKNKFSFKMTDSFIFITLIVLLTTMLSKSYEYSPEAILFRCMPGAIWRLVPFLFSATAILIVFFYVFLNYEKYRRNMFALYQVFIILLLLSCFNVSLFSQTETVVKNFRKSDLDTILRYTPSAFLLSSYFGDSSEKVTSVRQYYDSLALISLTDEAGCTGTSSIHPELSSFALDGSHKTRWSSGKSQYPGLWYEIECQNPVSVRQIHLSIALFKSDFPRGLRIEIERDGVYEELIALNEWLGPVKFSTSGLPYFGPQSDVVFDFPAEVTSKKFRFILTRDDPVFDWSIAKILFLN